MISCDMNGGTYTRCVGVVCLYHLYYYGAHTHTYMYIIAYCLYIEEVVLYTVVGRSSREREKNERKKKKG